MANISSNGYTYTSYQGCKVRPVHLLAMQAAASGTANWGPLNLSQGGLSTAVAASADTHRLLDVVDIKVGGKSKALVWEFCKNLFECGNLPFPRGYTNDGFTKHIHNLWWPATAGTTSLRNQYKDYLNGKNGLVGHGPYVGPKVPAPLPYWADSMFNTANMKAFSGYIRTTATTGLIGNDRYRQRVNVLPLNSRVLAVRMVYRWNRWNYVTSGEVFYSAQYCQPESE